MVNKVTLIDKSNKINNVSKFRMVKMVTIFVMVHMARLSQSQAMWAHCGQEICIESQEISVNIHVFDLVASQMSDIK